MEFALDVSHTIRYEIRDYLIRKLRVYQLARFRYRIADRQEHIDQRLLQLGKYQIARQNHRASKSIVIDGAARAFRDLWPAARLRAPIHEPHLDAGKLAIMQAHDQLGSAPRFQGEERVDNPIMRVNYLRLFFRYDSS